MDAREVIQTVLMEQEVASLEGPTEGTVPFLPSQKLGQSPGKLGQSSASRESLLPILRAVQQRLGHLPAEIFAEIEAQLGIPRHIGYSVASFYDEFRFDRPAKHVIRVCDGAVCELAGCRELLAALLAGVGHRPGRGHRRRLFSSRSRQLPRPMRTLSRRPDRRLGFRQGGHFRIGRVAAARAGRRRTPTWPSCSGGPAETMSFPKARPGEHRRLLDAATARVQDGRVGSRGQTPRLC